MKTKIIEQHEAKFKQNKEKQKLHKDNKRISRN